MEYGSEFDWRANEGFLTDSADFVKEDWHLYRSGRDALKALARSVGKTRVLLPALCCESMILPFTQNGCEIVFYRLNEDLSGNEADVREKLTDGALLLYMRYFGIRPFSDAFLQSLRADGYLLAEDRTQDIIVPRESEGFVPDYMLASLRKWAALPDGGMLRGGKITEDARADSAFGDLRVEAMREKTRYLESWEAALKQDFLHRLAAASDMLDADAVPVAMSGGYEALLRSLDFGKLYAARLRNIQILKNRLEPLERDGLLRFLTHAPEQSTLYFPIRLQNRNAVQKAMAARDIYCPVIWPEPEESAGVCPVSHAVVSDMLAIPCDQRYDEQDMEFIAANLTEILRGARL